ncbi:MAG TPA: hypothetical protein VGO62_16305 [Myxococcota bacterium]|jgi:hypothetical protein
MSIVAVAIAALAVLGIVLVQVLRRNDRRVERDDPGVNASGGPGFDDDDDAWPRG